METRRFPVRRALRWSLAGCCAALLWVAGYFGGRNAGYDGGFAHGRNEGFAVGRVEGIRQTVERYSSTTVYEEVYVVDDLIAERLAPQRSSSHPAAAREVAAEMGELVDEILSDVAPDYDPVADPSFQIAPFPTNRSLVVSADGARHAEISVYLDSKEDYLAWKRSRETKR